MHCISDCHVNAYEYSTRQICWYLNAFTVWQIYRVFALVWGAVLFSLCLIYMHAVTQAHVLQQKPVRLCDMELI